MENMETDYEISRLGGRRAYETYKLESFQPKSDQQKQALEYCTNFDPKSDNMMLIGPAGTGKTHLAVGTARKFSSDVWKPMEISRHLRASENAEDEHKRIRNLIDWPCIVIDDLGVEKCTEWLTVLLFEIIDGRYQAMSGGLIITANVGLDGLAQRLGDDRISSRLAQMCKRFTFTGHKDQRTK
jgi:DNA replication protein DnaC